MNGLEIAMRAKEETLLADGEADSHRTSWRYAVTGTYPSATPVSITATAVDRGGNQGSKMTIWS